MSNIFDVVNTDSVATIDPNQNYYENLVGEGKKFKDNESLARGKAESDAFIEKLKAEAEALRKELNTKASFETILDQIKSSKEPANPAPIPLQGDLKTVELDDSVLESKLAEILSRRDQQRTHEGNLEKAVRVMRENYGDQAQAVINHKASEIGMTPAALQKIATESPSAFFRLVGVSESPAPGQAPVVPRNGLNTVHAADQGNVKNKAYYDRMKNTDPKRYNDPKTTSEMMKSLAECRRRGIAWE